MDELGKMVRQKRKLENTKVTNENKTSLINQVNKSLKTYGFGKLGKDATFNDIRQAKKQMIERMEYDIAVMAVEEGNTVIASIDTRNLKKSSDSTYKKIGTFAPAMSEAKKEANKKVTKKEQEFLDKSNSSILGFGNKDLITEVEKAGNDKKIKQIIEDVKKQKSASDVYTDKQLDIFNKVFEKVEAVREKDLDKLRKAIEAMSLEKVSETVNILFKTLDVYPSPQYRTAERDGDDTELANARLDDMLIKMGLSKHGIRKTQKTLQRYERTKKKVSVKTKRN